MDTEETSALRSDPDRARPVAVLVEMETRQGHEEMAKREVSALFERIRTEESACAYIVGHQDVENPRRLMFYEQWRDQDEFNAFRESRDYMRAYLERMTEHVAEGTFSLWAQFA